jgi:hypothetical protein
MTDGMWAASGFRIPQLVRRCLLPCGSQPAEAIYRGGDVMGRFAELRDLRERMEHERASWRESRLLGFHEDSQRRAWDEYRRVVRLAPWWLRGRHAAAVRKFPGTEGPM